jgi:hypothetical protein
VLQKTFELAVEKVFSAFKRSNARGPDRQAMQFSAIQAADEARAAYEASLADDRRGAQVIAFPRPEGRDDV